jgi:hypothetical protein
MQRQPRSWHLTRLRQLIPVAADGKSNYSILNTYVDAINNLIPLTANINTINRNHFRKARVRRFLLYLSIAKRREAGEV